MIWAKKFTTFSGEVFSSELPYTPSDYVTMEILKMAIDIAIEKESSAPTLKSNARDWQSERESEDIEKTILLLMMRRSGGWGNSARSWPLHSWPKEVWWVYVAFPACGKDWATSPYFLSLLPFELCVHRQFWRTPHSATLMTTVLQNGAAFFREGESPSISISSLAARQGPA